MRKLLLILSFLALIGFSGSAGLWAATGPVEFRAVLGEAPASIDPVKMLSASEQQLAMGLFEGLVVADPKTGKALPGVAESWSVNGDGTEYTFKLRNATWSDGTPVTAKQFVAGWMRVLDPANQAPWVWGLAPFIEGASEYAGASAEDAPGLKAGVKVKAIDDKTFWFKTPSRMPCVITVLSHFVFYPLPTQVFDKLNAAGKGDEWTSVKNFVGNGPYVLKDSKADTSVVLEKNAKYWDAASVKVQKLTYTVQKDAAAAYELYKSGQVDWIPAVPAAAIAEASARKDFVKSPLLSSYFYILEANSKAFKDKRVRQALAAAIDRDKLVKLPLSNSVVPAYGLVPPIDGYDVQAPTVYNPAAAKQLLAQAGFANGKGFPELTLIYNASDNHKAIAEFLAKSWADVLGIKVKFSVQDFNNYIPTRQSHAFDLARGGWVGDFLDPSNFLELFRSSDGSNDGEYANSDYDGLLDQAATQTDGASRYALLKKAETLMLQDTAIIPLYYYASQQLIDTSVWGGWYANVQDLHPTKFLFKK